MYKYLLIFLFFAGCTNEKKVVPPLIVYKHTYVFCKSPMDSLFSLPGLWESKFQYKGAVTKRIYYGDTTTYISDTLKGGGEGSPLKSGIRLSGGKITGSGTIIFDSMKTSKQ